MNNPLFDLKLTQFGTTSDKITPITPKILDQDDYRLTSIESGRKHLFEKSEPEEALGVQFRQTDNNGY